MTPANIDLATSEALKIAREVDPDGETQIRVIFSTCTALSKWCTLKLRGSHNFLSDIKYMYDVILVLQISLSQISCLHSMQIIFS